jgi:hypothetical protein
MSARLEAFLARLYVDDASYRRFLDDAATEIARAGLTDEERASIETIDRPGLELARASFRHKREGTRQ